MILFHIKSILRLIVRNRVLSSIKIIGLGVGVATFFLIALYLLNEVRYDTQHPASERLFRFVHRVSTPEGIQDFAFASATIGPALKEKFPEVESYTRILFSSASVRNKNRDVGFNELGFGFADQNFFKTFNFPIEGNAETALVDPYSVVITPAMAAKYFGNENPIGQSLIINGIMDFVVKGLVKEEPNLTHLKFDFIASFATLEAIGKNPVLATQFPASQSVEAKGFAAFYTYIKLTPGASYVDLNSKFPAFIEDFRGKGKSSRLKPFLQPVRSIHLSSALLYEIDQNGSYQTVYVFLAIGISILLIASINYVNLSTAEFINRARGVALKKILGVKRRTLLLSHVLETMVLSALAVLIGLLLAYIFLPYFNGMVNRNISWDHPQLIWTVVAIWLTTVIAAGTYPSLAITQVPTLEAFKGSVSSISFFNVRNSLVFFQVLVCFCLLSMTFIIFDQLRYMLNRDLGFKSKQILVIKADGTSRAARESLKTSLAKVTEITGLAGSSLPPGVTLSSLGLTVPQNSGDEERRIGVYQMYVDAGFIATMGIPVTAGRNFDEGNPSDSTKYFIVNQTAADLLAGDDHSVLSKEVNVPDLFGAGVQNRKAVIGVINDFHFESLQKPIGPLILEYNPARVSYILVRINGPASRSLIEGLEKEWKEINPALPFDYYFLDEGLSKLYDNEKRLRQTVLFFAGIAIGLAALGLFGTTFFAVQQRTREIGIRKVLGSGQNALFILLLKPVAILVFVSCVIGVPLAYYFGGHWLSQYAYRIDVNPLLFVTSFVVILILVFCSLSYHFLKVNRINPVDVLREH